MGYASALAWVLLVIIGIFTAIAFLTSKYWVYYEDARSLRRCARSARQARRLRAAARAPAARSLKHVCLILASFGMLYPLLWMVASSFKPESQIFGDLAPLADAQFDLSNYSEGWYALRESASPASSSTPS